MARKIRLLLVDDQVMTIKSLESISEFEIVHVVNKAIDFDLAFKKYVSKVHLVLMDLMLDTRDVSNRSLRFSGLDLIRSAIKTNPSCPIAVFSQFEYEEMIKQAYNLGAIAYLNKNVPLELFVESVKAVSKGKRIPPLNADGETTTRLKILVDERFKDLKNREIEILELYCDGFSSRDIAAEFGIGNIRSLNNRISAILKNGRFANREELLSYLQNF